jgi:hypothetical protein
MCPQQTKTEASAKYGRHAGRRADEIAGNLGDVWLRRWPAWRGLAEDDAEGPGVEKDLGDDGAWSS